MNIDKFGIPSYTLNELTTAMYRGFFDLEHVFVDQPYPELEKFNAESVYDLKVYQEPNISIEEFDRSFQSEWFIPKEYQELDIIEYIISLCPPDEEAMLRLATELDLYQRHNMIDLLKWIKFFIDTCRGRNVLWGLGRGSSVASYVLFLMGLHKIDPLKYNLDITEFFKGE